MPRDVPLQVVDAMDGTPGMRQGLLHGIASGDSDVDSDVSERGMGGGGDGVGGGGGRGRSTRLGLMGADHGREANAMGMRQRALAEKLAYIGRGILGMPPPERVGMRDEGGVGLQDGSSIAWAEVGQDMSGWGGGWGGGVGSAELESLDFDTINNPHWVDGCRKQPRTMQGFMHTMMTSKTVYRSVLAVVIGVGPKPQTPQTQTLNPKTQQLGGYSPSSSGLA